MASDPMNHAKVTNMIIPTPEFDPLFAEDGVPFRTKMIQYINREFADLLATPIDLLHKDEGPEILAGIGFPEDREAMGRKAA